MHKIFTQFYLLSQDIWRPKVEQRDREWTEDERKKMEESVLYIDEFRLIGPSNTEMYNRSAVTLSCRLSPKISAVDLEIRWFKETDCVCVYKNSKVTEGRGYEGRVSLFTQELERGNVSLQLRDCKRSDDGDYLCQVTDGDRTEEITVCMLDIWRPKVEQVSKLL
ncbi:butyrophilin-like protein 2 isoform X2 [Tachysurus fulvidraco]|uniref:butyrophilin-like protein 2 isoform X2 n=1 Tax=Tachysurus fulvidraco TaxID=1234273 RepID=UPI001FEF7B22|nr:butyrophilin-like protein 2 isoform X2 [Tachysurus fulvidraco]